MATRSSEDLTSLRTEVAALEARQEEAIGALGDLRQLASQSLERQARWPERLAELRRGSAWKDAYSLAEPLVTVRIATFNRSELLSERTLPSVVRQSYEHWEAIVVGDACTDDTAERLETLGDPRIQFHNLDARGPYPADPQQRWYVAGIPAMNAGARMAKGSWIAPLDDDDEWSGDHLEVLLRTARDAESEVAYGKLVARLDAPPLEAHIGSWPPRSGDFAWQSGIYNAALREFEYDMACRFAGEPGDWNLARRMWEAGVRFSFIDQVVGTYHVTGATDAKIGWFHARASDPSAGRY